MLSDKVVVVAGAGHGIGEAAAVELGAQNATVVVNDLGVDLSGEGETAEPAEDTADAVREAGGEAMAHFGDITSFEYTEQLLEDTVDEYGRIDGVVNFAGILRDGMSWTLEEDEWDAVIDVHLKGHFSLLRNVAAHWRERARDAEDDSLDRQRSYLGVSSGAAFGNPGQTNYTAAKAGVLGMVRTAAMELYRFNIRVNTLMPGAYTRMLDSIPDEQLPFTEDERPPEKVAPMVAFMMSDVADDISGRMVKASGDRIGLVSEPDYHAKTAIRDGGWSTEEIAESFHEVVGAGEDLTNTEGQF